MEVIKEYHRTTEEEVAGPLMLVRHVEGRQNMTKARREIELPSGGNRRRCRVRLEVNGSPVLVQLFESSAGITLPSRRCAL